MYKTILMSTDGSELATRGVEQGAQLARTFGARVVLVTVTEPWIAPGSIAGAAVAVNYDAYEAAAQEQAADIFRKTRAAVSLDGLDVTTVHVADSFAADGIVRTAEAQGAELIVMASHGRRGVGRLLLGSQTVDVLTHTKVPVLVVR